MRSPFVRFRVCVPEKPVFLNILFMIGYFELLETNVKKEELDMKKADGIFNSGKKLYLIAKATPLNDQYEADSWRMPYRVVADASEFIDDDEAEIYEILPDGSLRLEKGVGSRDPIDCGWIRRD